MPGRGCAAASLAALVLLACRTGSAAAPDANASWARAHTVTVAMVDFRFIPDHLEFHAGIAYRLHFVNRSQDWHEFTAPKFFKDVTLGNPQALDPDFAVPPGKARNFYFLAPRPGHFRFWCADHDWAGMVGTITIE